MDHNNTLGSPSYTPVYQNVAAMQVCCTLSTLNPGFCIAPARLLRLVRCTLHNKSLIYDSNQTVHCGGHY